MKMEEAVNLQIEYDLPKGLDLNLEECISSLCFALYAWDQLNLEIGEASIVTGNDKFSNLIAQVALWHGAIPCLFLGKQAKQLTGIDYIEVNFSDPEETVIFLKSKINNKPGIAVLDLSGKPELISILLEHLPRWTRIMLAGPIEKPLTLDYYNHIHRNGAYIFSILYDPSIKQSTENNSVYSLYFSKAMNIMKNEEMKNIILEICK